MQFPVNVRITGLALVVAMAACTKVDKVEPEVTPPATDHFRPATDKSSAFISQVFDYQPAPGQFINGGSLGTPAGAKELIGGYNALLSLGAYGGYVTFGFDHSIENKDGKDLGVYGNPLINEGQEWSEAGIVMVMQDLNGNGKPDDGEWYELAGSEYNKPTTIKKYRITYYNPKQKEAADVLWKDNQGKSGYVLANTFHNNPYYPTFAANQDTLVFEGTLLPGTLKKVFNAIYQSDIITNQPFSWGYSDSGSKDYLDLMATEKLAYNTFDISDAVNSKGEKVNLKHIDFVKVYTGQNCNGSLSTDPANPDRSMGEVSTEVSGAVDIRLKKK